MIQLEILCGPSEDQSLKVPDRASEPRREVPETDRRIGQTIAYMLQHLNQPLHVAKLAALANFSPSHFFALFKRRTGCAPIDFFIRLRMQHACQLLEATSLNVKEVAAVLGYDDPFYFSRTFKAVNRVAPSEYRTMPRKRKQEVMSVALLAGFVGAEDSPEGASAGAPAARHERGTFSAGTRTASGPVRVDTGWNGRMLDERQPLSHSEKLDLCQAK
jgi:AraC-like DNA-binding protein